MLELVKHIEYLLTNHDCVIIPGLGGFVLQYVPAYFCEDHKSIQPPGKQITFNASLSYNDGLLAQSLMQESGTNYENAITTIDHWVSDIKKSLSNAGDSYVLGELGMFVVSVEGTIIFEPNTSYISKFFSFGLRKINICPLGQLHKIEEVEQRPDIITKKRDVVYIPISKSLIRQLVAAAAVVIILLMISTPMNQTMTTSDYAALVSSELFENKVENVNVDRKDTTTFAITNNTAEPTTQENEMLKLQAVETATLNPYIIVVATLSGKQAALRQLAYFRQQGVTADLKIYETPNKVRIYIESFSDKKDAQDFLMSLRNSDSPFPDAWVMHIKK